MKTFLKARVLFPVLFGWALGGLLFVLGAADDAPGLSFIGLSVAFLLTMRGVYHAGVLPQGYCLPIILLVFGAVGVVMPFHSAAGWGAGRHAVSVWNRGADGCSAADSGHKAAQKDAENR